MPDEHSEKCNNELDSVLHKKAADSGVTSAQSGSGEQAAAGSGRRDRVAIVLVHSCLQYSTPAPCTLEICTRGIRNCAASGINFCGIAGELVCADWLALVVQTRK